MFKKPLLNAFVTAALLAGAPFANALVALDSWQLDTGNSSIGPSLTTDIGHLGVQGGQATVLQEIGADLLPFVGARFTEFGNIFSVNYIPDNVEGLGDFGIPSDFDGGLDLEIRFSGLSGQVTSFDALTGAIEFSFDPGVGTIGLYGSFDGFATDDLLMSFQMAGPSGGDLSDFYGPAGSTQGQSTITTLLTGGIADLLRDEDGESQDARIAEGDVFGLLITTNTIVGGFAPTGPCPFDEAALCASGNVTSDGSFDLLRVPEPMPIALLGVGLVMLSLVRRRKAH